MPVDVIDLAPGKQRYGLLLTDEGGILDDLMFFNRGDDLFVIVNGACKAADIAHIQAAHRRALRGASPCPTTRCSRCRARRPSTRWRACRPASSSCVFMTGGAVQIGRRRPVRHPQRLHRRGRLRDLGAGQRTPKRWPALLLAQPEVKPIGLGARNSLRLEAGLCLYGNDIDTTTTPVEAALNWAMQKVRRTGGARAGGFPGAAKVLAPAATAAARRSHTQARRPGRAGARAGARAHRAAGPSSGRTIGEVTSGLLGPTVDRPIAMGYVAAALRRARHPRAGHRARQARADGSEPPCPSCPPATTAADPDPTSGEDP